MEAKLIISFKLKYTDPVKKSDQIVLHESFQCEGLKYAAFQRQIAKNCHSCMDNGLCCTLMMEELPEDAGRFFFFLIAAPQNKILLQSLL